MNAATTANAYKRQQIMTASPQELTLMLYNGAIRFVSESLLAIERRDLEKAHIANMRAQNIVREFIVTTDRKQEIAKSWLQIDEYILHCLVQGNIKKDPARLQEAKRLLTEFRDAWLQAMRQLRPEKNSG